ncbi:unnamed protein product [Phytomonas sp. Hart1]|nr:unnamed protein product [Phytomonas sp. Hart1]|eukprot:CCW68575.1 unnamed protein product [Phytomonas sp. isolate Hart1]
MSRSSSIPPQCGRAFGANLTNVLRSPTPTPADSEQGALLPCLKGSEFGGLHKGAEPLPPLKRHKTELHQSEDQEADMRVTILLSPDAREEEIGASVTPHVEGCSVSVRRGTPSPPPSFQIGFDQGKFRCRIHPSEASLQLNKTGAYTMAPKYLMGSLPASASRRSDAASENIPQSQVLGCCATNRFEWANESTHLCQSADVIHQLWQRAYAEDSKADSSSDELEDVNPILELCQQQPNSFSLSTKTSPNKKSNVESRVQNVWPPFVCKEALELFTNAFDSVYNL